jgi:hypothetical protein
LNRFFSSAERLGIEVGSRWRAPFFNLLSQVSLELVFGSALPKNIDRKVKNETSKKGL